IVERAIANGHNRRAVEVELTILVLTEQLIEKDGVLRSKFGNPCDPLPSVQRQKAAFRTPIPRPMRGRVYPLVKDVVERRTDGRPGHAEPLDAFADALTELGHGPFRLWWTQTASELK